MISVILPTFNEAKNIIPMLSEVRKYLTSSDEIIVVDDNSPDGTGKIVEQYTKNDPNLVLLTRLENPGLTNSLQAGIELAKGDTLIWLDADLSQPPNKIPELVKEIKAGHNIVVASRYVKGGGDARFKSLSLTVSIQVFLSFTLRVITSLILWSKFSDWSSGYIAVDKKSIPLVTPLRGDYGEYFINLIYQGEKNNLKILEIPYILTHRIHGESKTATNLFGLVKRGIKYIITIFKIRLS